MKISAIMKAEFKWYIMGLVLCTYKLNISKIYKYYIWNYGDLQHLIVKSVKNKSSYYLRIYIN